MLPQALDQALVTAQEQGKVRTVIRPLDCCCKSQYQRGNVSLHACGSKSQSERMISTAVKE